MQFHWMFGYKLNSIFIRSMYLIYAFACRYEARPNRQEATGRWWSQRKTHLCEPPCGSHERTFTLFLQMVAHMSGRHAFELPFCFFVSEWQLTCRARIRDRVRQSQFTITYIPTSRNLADYFTKNLPFESHAQFHPFRVRTPTNASETPASSWIINSSRGCVEVRILTAI